MSENTKNFDNIEDAYPLSKLQAGMLFHSEFEPDSSIYHDVFKYDMQGKYDSDILRKAIEQVTERHSILRTSFNLSDFSQPLQLVNKTVEISIEEIDIQNFSSEEQKHELFRHMEEEKHRPFNWTQAPLYRFIIHRINNEAFQLMFSFHHSILDGWSVATLMTELFSTYTSFLANKMHIIEELPQASFRDFIALELEALGSDEHKSYWIKKLKDSESANIYRWSNKDSKNGPNTKTITIADNIYIGLEQLSKTLRVPMRSILLAGHLRALSLISGTDSVITGLVSNGRPEVVGGERILGLFLNTLPFYVEFTGGTWIDLIRTVVETEQEVLKYRRYPMSQIQEDLKRSFLLETVFNYVDFHVYSQANTNEQKVSSTILEGFEQTNFALGCTFSVNKAGKQIYLSIAYESSDFCKEQIEAIAGYYNSVFLAMASTPNEKYSNNFIIPLEEKQKLLNDWSIGNSQKINYISIYEMFEEQAKRNPENIAAIFNNSQLTYRELNEKANSLSRYLQKQGAKGATLVGVYMERSFELLISILAIWKAGCAYVPLDPVYPHNRLNFIMEDTNASIIITKNEMLSTIPSSKAKIICVDKEWKKIDKEKSNNLAIDMDKNNLAYIIYTSGSTGKPKGVLVTHRGLPNAVEEYRDTFGITYNDRILQIASLGFDAAIAEIIMTLGNGATLCLANRQELLPGINLLQLMEKLEISIATMTPSALAYLPIKQLPKLRVLNVAGEACSRELVNIWGEGRKFFNLYGPTEATIWTTVYECKIGEDRLPIGRPIKNVQSYILDLKQQLVPTGVHGELYIGGIGLANGYLNRPELTNERFIENPYGNDGKLYRTGDLVRYLSDGNIEFLGRIDRQVKLRGFRIELGELEYTITQYDGVKEAIVIVREDKPRDKRLVAYIVPKDKDKKTFSGLRGFLQARLPEYMVPSAFEVMDNMPLTSNGKIDLNALPLPDGSRPELTKQYVAPRTATEKTLTDIWSEILGVKSIGIFDNFFELGGHSLLALQLISRIRDTFNIELPLKNLFEAPTIEKLALTMLQDKSLKESNDEMEQLLLELEQISDDEAKEMLR